MSAIAHKLNPSLYDAIERGPQVSNGQDVNEDPEDDDNEAMDYDDDEAFGLPGVTVSSALKLDRLQGYAPSFIRI